MDRCRRGEQQRLRFDGRRDCPRTPTRRTTRPLRTTRTTPSTRTTATVRTLRTTSTTRRSATRTGGVIPIGRITPMAGVPSSFALEGQLDQVPATGTGAKWCRGVATRGVDLVPYRMLRARAARRRPTGRHARGTARRQAHRRDARSREEATRAAGRVPAADRAPAVAQVRADPALARAAPVPDGRHSRANAPRPPNLDDHCGSRSLRRSAVSAVVHRVPNRKPRCWSSGTSWLVASTVCCRSARGFS